MSWAPNDLVADADLVAYERTILSQFASADWQTRRQKALEDWLFPLLEAQGFNPQRLRTRFTPTAVIAETSSAQTDRTASAATSEGLDLSTILAAGADALYVGFDAPFRGLSVRMVDHLNALASVATFALWADEWASVAASDGTIAASGKSFSRGGAVTWTIPAAVVRRTVGTAGPAYWARVQLPTTPTAGTAIGPISVIRRSRLCAAVTFRTLALIFREAPTGQDGPWTEKADWYEAEAQRAWLRVLDQIGGEFDADDDDVVNATEANQTAAEVSGGGWTLERA